ncbi:MAG: hypothetical protein JSV25_01940 [Spirochaetota bacterium]|nr:MAG: hypothetical protein JSV25_01940 [Spirochaetota bacterium]
MPEKILCTECDFLLYFGEIIKKRLYMRNLPSEEKVLEMYNNTCPRCKNKLTLKTVKIAIER